MKMITAHDIKKIPKKFFEHRYKEDEGEICFVINSL